MSKLGTLTVKPKTITIGGEEYTLIPLGMGSRDVISKVLDAKDKKEQMESSFDLIKSVLKNSYPDATEDELNKIDFQYLPEITKAILELHGMKLSEEELKKLMAEKVLG